MPSIIASSTSQSPVITRSRSDADGEEPLTSNQLPAGTVVTRQPADGLGHPQTTWRTRTNEQRVTSWSESEEDESVPPSSRLRPVLIGGEDERSTENDPTLLSNLSLD